MPVFLMLWKALLTWLQELKEPLSSLLALESFTNQTVVLEVPKTKSALNGVYLQAKPAAHS